MGRYIKIKSQIKIKIYCNCNCNCNCNCISALPYALNPPSAVRLAPVM